MKNLKLDTAIRAKLVGSVMDSLRLAAPTSTILLRGSLATNTADQYSDIDMLWQVPDLLFNSLVDNLEQILSGVRAVESLRFDPDFTSEKRRLGFVRFEDVPLFWRLDLEIFAQSTRRDSEYDRDNPNARRSEWSVTESALMNAVAGIKAHLRDRDHDARQLLIRAYERMGLDPYDGELEELLAKLVKRVRTRDPSMHLLAQKIDKLILETF
jgi:hypothetical protein